MHGERNTESCIKNNFNFNLNTNLRNPNKNKNPNTKPKHPKDPYSHLRQMPHTPPVLNIQLNMSLPDPPGRRQRPRRPPRLHRIQHHRPTRHTRKLLLQELDHLPRGVLLHVVDGADFIEPLVERDHSGLVALRGGELECTGEQREDVHPGLPFGVFEMVDDVRGCGLEKELDDYLCGAVDRDPGECLLYR